MPHANLTGTNLSGATLTGVSSGAIVGSPAALPSGWSLVTTGTDGGYLVGFGANLNSASLQGSDLSGANFSGVTLAQAHMENSNLTGATLAGADLTGVDLVNDVGLSPASLTGVVWSSTKCPDGSFSNTNGTSPQSCIGHL